MKRQRKKSKPAFRVARGWMLGAALTLCAIAGLRMGTHPRAITLPYLTARYIAVMETGSGRFLYEKDSDTPHSPASVTKLMTLLLILDDIESGKLSWEDSWTVTEEEAYTPGSKYGMRPGEVFTVRQLVAGTALSSGCDCVQCLVRLCAGNEADFVRRMNERARDLRLRGSHFVNSTGIDAAEHYMTARDIAALTRVLVRSHPEILDFTSAASLTVGDREFHNLNRLAGRDSRVRGMKTGTTDMGGYNLVTLAEQDRKSYIIVLLDSNNEESRFIETEKVLDTLFGEA